MENSKWQAEFDALPAWAQKMVRALAGCQSHGIGGDSYPHEENADIFRLALDRDKFSDWWSGFDGMLDLAQALTAPWPPPDAPARERRVFNVVELLYEDGGFDQPCAFGNRVGGHAVYCHNDAWPNSPRKCRRNRDDYKHEDCPGFVANPDAEPAP